jgi:hypothetical protein
MKKTMFLSVSLCTLIAAGAVAAETPAKPVVSAAAAETAVPATPSGHPAMPTASAPASPDATAAPAAPQPLAGKVLQTMNAGGYSYIYIEQANGKKNWVAVSETPVKVGAEMSFKPGTEMGKFESKALKRTFDSIIFSDGVLAGAASASENNKKVSPGSSGATADKSGKISVTKATGDNAYTVEGAIKNSAKLNKKKVVIRGQVVKVSLGIMDKNWIHIQDGSGSAAKKTHNLVCTSPTDSADVGDVVTITGTLYKDKDFGSGYKYAVIVEDAKVAK